MFFKDVPYSNETNKIDGIDVSKYTTHFQSMYKAQQKAVLMALTHKVFNINGPAATGKSQTLAIFILIVAFMGYDVLVSTPTNVAVDSLLERVRSMTSRFDAMQARAIVKMWSLHRWRHSMLEEKKLWSSQASILRVLDNV